MKEEIRIMIAFALALTVIILFSMTSRKERPIQIQERKIQKEDVNQLQTVNDYTISESQIEFGNKLFTGSIDLLGGKIVSFSLSKHTRPNEERFTFFRNGLTLLDVVDGETQQVRYIPVYSSSESLLILQGKRDNLEIEKKIEISSLKYKWNANIQIKNISKEKLNTPEMNIFLGSIVLDRRHPEDSSVECLFTNGGKPYRFNVSKQMKEKVSGNVCVVKTRYQMYYFKTDTPVEFTIENIASKIRWSLKIPSFEILPGKVKNFPVMCYIGPSDYFVAKNEITDIRIFGTGFFVSMGRLIFSILNGIHKFVPNWGLTIIILTVLIKIIFFPLTRSSLRSMKQMQKLRPYLQDIQKKYKNNPQMMQKEMMNLYKEYKINPFSGCLPMLIQIPIFVGFFLALRSSIFLRGSKFILWIKDLSMPDTVASIGSFPINVLPVLMFVSSFFQQKMTPTVEQSQKFMNIMLPLMMLVLFYNFSSGLLLYWVSMNIMGIFEQHYIYRISKK